MIAALVTGCEVGPDYHAPKVPVQSDYRATIRPVTTQPTTGPTTLAATQPVLEAAATQPAAPVDLTHWWQTFSDPTLNRLIEQAIDRNLDVQLAQERVLQARAQLAYVRGGFFPTVDATGSFARSRGSKNAFATGGSASSSTGGNTTGTGGTGGSTGTGSTGTNSGTSGQSAQSFSSGETSLYQAGFDASWELDVFGGTRRAIEAADYALQSQVEARRNAMISLLSELAQNYIMLRGYQHELEIVQRNTKSQHDTLDLQRQKLSAGIATDLTVAQAEAQLASTESQLPTLETDIKQALQRIAVLIDRDPQDVAELLGTDAGVIPVGPDLIPPGLPSELLRRRPDVRQAERNLASSSADIGVAVSELFPKISLTGSVGVEANKFRTTFDSSSIFYSYGPNVSWRIFDAGVLLANVQIEKALHRAAYIEYRQSVLQAFSDVENSLTAYNREQVRRQALRRAVDSNRRSLDLARQLNNAGVVDFLNVLDAQLSLFQAEDQLAQSDQAVSVDLVALYKALGGGWENTDSMVQERFTEK